MSTQKQFLDSVGLVNLWKQICKTFPSRTGDGASGNWDINISGNAGNSTLSNVYTTSINFGFPIVYCDTVGLDNDVIHKLYKNTLKYNPSSNQLFTTSTPLDTKKSYIEFTDDITLSMGASMIDLRINESLNLRFAENSMIPNSSYSLGTEVNYFNESYIFYGCFDTISSKISYSTDGFWETSDERLKMFGDKIKVDLDKIKSLKKNYFKWKDGKESTQIGVSAQEIQKLYPELVSEKEDGTLTVAYDKLSVVALAAIDELHEKNKELENRLAKLENLLNKLTTNE